MNDIVTRDMLTRLGNNVCSAFAVLHPDGLSMEQLAEKANEHRFYKLIYYYAQEAAHERVEVV